MIKIIKKIGIVFLAIILLIIVGLFIVILLDKNSTNYLNISNNSNWQQQNYIIKNVNLVPMTKDTILPNKMVLIKDGYITAIDSLIPLKSFSVIDGKNQYLSPGLIDMHVHVWDKQELGLYLANGVTTVRNMWGIPYHLDIKEAINSNTIIAPRFFTATPKLTGPNDAGLDKVQIQSPQVAKKHITKYKEQGYDVIKTYAGMPENIYNAILEQATIENLNIATHPSYEVDYSYHFKPSFETIEHTEEIVQTALQFKKDSIKLKSIIDLYVKHQKTHTPTLTIFQNIIDILEEDDIRTSEMAQYVNPGLKKIGSIDDYNRWTSEKEYDSTVTNRLKTQHKTHLEIVKQLHDHNINIVCGSDAGIMYAAPGFSTHEELSYYTEAGLSPFEALKTATVNPTKVSNLYKDFGTIEIGKMANFILSKNNPLEDLKTLKNPEMVLIDGRLLNKEALETFKEKAKNRSNGIATIYRFLISLL